MPLPLEMRSDFARGSGNNSTVWQQYVDITFLMANCIILLGTFLVGIAANIFVTWAVYHQKSLQTWNNALLVNLAVIDFLRCAIDCPIILVIMVTVHQRGQADGVICNLQMASFSFSCCIQMVTLACISAERYQAIAYPFKITERKRRIIIFIPLTWTFAILVAAICMTFVKDSPVYVKCHGSRFKSMYYDTFGLYILIPLWTTCFALITGFYARIFAIVKAHSQKIFDKGVSLPAKEDKKDVTEAKKGTDDVCMMPSKGTGDVCMMPSKGTGDVCMMPSKGTDDVCMMPSKGTDDVCMMPSKGTDDVCMMPSKGTDDVCMMPSMGTDTVCMMPSMGTDTVCMMPSKGTDTVCMMPSKGKKDPAADEMPESQPDKKQMPVESVAQVEKVDHSKLNVSNMDSTGAPQNLTETVSVLRAPHHNEKIAKPTTDTDKPPDENLKKLPKPTPKVTKGDSNECKTKTKVHVSEVVSSKMEKTTPIVAHPVIQVKAQLSNRDTEAHQDSDRVPGKGRDKIQIQESKSPVTIAPEGPVLPSPCVLPSKEPGGPEEPSVLPLLMDPEKGKNRVEVVAVGANTGDNKDLCVVSLARNPAPDAGVATAGESEAVTDAVCKMPSAVTDAVCKMPSAVTDAVCKMPSAVTDAVCMMPSKGTDDVCMMPSAVTDTVCMMPSMGTDAVCMRPSKGTDDVCMMPSKGTDDVCMMPSKGTDDVCMMPSMGTDAVCMRPSKGTDDVCMMPSKGTDDVCMMPSKGTDAVCMMPPKGKKDPAAESGAGNVCLMQKGGKDRGNKKKESKLAKRSGYIILTFLLFWLPLITTILVNVLVFHNRHSETRIIQDVEILFISIACMTSVSDPLIYAAVNPQFRTEFYRLRNKLKAWWKKKKKK